MKNYIEDATRALTRLRGDDNGAFLMRHLVTATLSELFRYEFPAAKWASGQLVSIVAVDEGALAVEWYTLARTGKGAAIVADNATDIPKAGIRAEMEINKAVTVATSIEFSSQELRSSRMQALFDLGAEKAQAAREEVDLQLDQLIRVGSPLHGLQGMLNLSHSHHVSATTGAWATTGTTAAQILADFLLAYSAIYTGSQGIEDPDTVVFPTSVWPRLATTQNSVASDTTILEFLKLAYPRISLWTEDPRLDTGGDDGGPCMMLYSRQSSRIKAFMPMALRPMPQEQHGLVYTTVFESRYAGIAAPRPRSVAKLSGI